MYFNVLPTHDNDYESYMIQAKGKQNRIAHAIRVHYEDNPQVYEARDYFRMSETTPCPRRLYYSRKGERVSNPFPPAVRMKMELGDIVHNYIRMKISEVTGWMITNQEEELVLKNGADGLQLIGHLDGIIRQCVSSSPEASTPMNILSSKSRSPIAVLEVKSTGEYGYASVKKTAFRDPTHYSHKYLIQGHRYIAAWNKKYPKEKVDTLCLILYNTNASPDKDTGVVFRDYWFKFDKHLLEDDLAFLSAVDKKIKAGEEPARGCLKDSMECKGCLYRDGCWE